MIRLANEFCGTGCLRYELDENVETIQETAAELAEILEDNGVVTPAQAQRFNADVGLFAKDLASFAAKCGKCSNFKLNGKEQEYRNILKQVEDFLKSLSKVKFDVTSEKEGDQCNAK